mgnify:CR=1 FL=1
MFGYTPSIDLRYFERFSCFIDGDITNTYERIYKDEREYVRRGCRDESLIVQYDASNIEGDIEELMQKSLDTGVDLIFEQVKDKKVIITKEMIQKAIDEMDLVFYD